jgi:hypothetical protein
MTLVALTTFFTISDSSGVVQGRFQNSTPGQVIRLDGFEFPYLSFIYSGAAKNRTGDNLEAEMTLAINQLAMSYAAEAVQKKWTVVVESCSMNPNDFSVGRKLTREVWLAAGMGYDSERVNVLLSSGIDAVGASAPARTLTSKLVGALPSTGQISNR